MEAQLRTTMPQVQQQTINVPGEKAQYLMGLSAMSVDTLRILHDLSKRPGVEKKLKDKEGMIKLFL